VFAEVAQQVLEYLGVPHDIDVRPPKTPDKPDKPVVEDEAQDSEADLNALFAAANDLPADDPLRMQGEPAPAAAGSRPAAEASKQTSAQATRPAPEPPALPGWQSGPAQAHSERVAVITSEKLLKVPSLVGLPLRKVVETSAAAGLQVRTTGSGTAREQAPAAGTMVVPGTQIVVLCAR